MIVIVTMTGSASVTSITFDGQSMSTVFNFTGGTSSIKYSVYSYFPDSSKASGSYNVVVGYSATGITADVWIGEYDGVKNDLTSVSSGSVSFTGSPITFSRTTVTQDAWVMAFGRFSAFARTANGSSDGVLRSPTSYTRAWVDSGADEGAPGSKSVNITSGSSPSGVVEYFTLELRRENSYTISFSESPTIADIPPSRSETRSLSESESFSERLTRATSRGFSEVIAFVEDVFVQASKRFIDSFSTTNILRRILTRRAAESVSLNERITRTFTRSFRDSPSFSDTPQFTGIWIPRSRPTASWTERSEPSASWTGRTKPSASYTNRSRPSSAWTNRTKPTTTWYE